MHSYRIKRFSQILNTHGGIEGFKSSRKYDQDMERLQKGKTLRELSKPNQFNEEIKKLQNELKEAKKR